MDCIFCKIISGDIPSMKLIESDSVVSFLDINPASEGHALVVPKRHFSVITEAGDDDLVNTFSMVKDIAVLLKKKMACDGYNILVNQERAAGQVVNHFHVHVIPRYVGDGLELPHVDSGVDEQRLKEIHELLKN